MTDRELMRQALEALEGLADTSWSEAFKQRKYDSDEPEENAQRECVLGVITALRGRLAQPDPRRKWVPLTWKEIAEILCDDRWQGKPEYMLLQMQARLKEENA